jgi:hypothetical protein
MKLLFTTFWQIALMRAHPEVLPASRYLLGLCLFVHWLTGITLGLFSLSPAQALLSALVGTLMMVALVQIILMLNRYRERFLQTITALAGCEVLIGLLAIPVTAIYYAGDAGKGAAALLSLAILGWNVAIAAHIFRHALSTSQGMGFVYAIGYMLFSITISGMLVATEA